MKLNNHGWGIKELIIYLCILLSFLLIAMFFINSLYNDIEQTQKDTQKENLNQNNLYEKSNEIDIEEEQIEIDFNYYENLEQQLYNATLQYLINGEIPEDTKYTTINIKTLIKKGYIDNLVDENNKFCEGYSNVAIDSINDYSIKSYIKCEEYTTDGY